MPDSGSDGFLLRDRIIHDRNDIELTRTRNPAESWLLPCDFHPTVGIIRSRPIKRLGTGWHWWFSESIHVPIGCRVEFRFLGPMHLLILYNEGRRRDGETSIEGLASSKLRNFANKLTLVPAGHVYREWHEIDTSTRVTFIYLDPAALQKSEGTDYTLRPRIYFEDSIVWGTASKLKAAIESGQEKCASYLEALSGVLSHELSRVDQTGTRQTATSRGGLAGWQRRIVVDHIEKHLGKQVCLAKLAGLAELSLHHFCRAFKQSFGIPPYQYQVQRRMEVAKSLLADRTISITDIALTLGYAQTSSFSSAFRKATDWTPTTYRRVFKEPETAMSSIAV